MKSLVAYGAPALVAALVLTVTSPAQADTRSVNDRAGDVWRTPAGEDGRHRKAGSQLNGDIDRTFVDHGSASLVLTTTFVRLARKKRVFQPVWSLRTESGTRYIALAYGGPGDWDGGHQLLTGSEARSDTGWPVVVDGQDAAGGDCAGMTHDANFRADTVSVEIPRSCLDDSAWVKVRSTAYSARRGSQRRWFDNGHNRGHSFRGWTDRVAAD